MTENFDGMTNYEQLALKRHYKRILDQKKADLDIKVERFKKERESLVIEDRIDESIEIQKEILDLNFACCELFLK